MLCDTFSCGEAAQVELLLADLDTGRHVPHYTAKLCYKCAAVEFGRYELHRKANVEANSEDRLALGRALVEDAARIAGAAWEAH
jgi:hypothetical protein